MTEKGRRVTFTIKEKVRREVAKAFVEESLAAATSPITTDHLYAVQERFEMDDRRIADLEERARDRCANDGHCWETAFEKDVAHRAAAMTGGEASTCSTCYWCGADRA